MSTIFSKLQGTGVALVTPFNAAGEVDFDALLRLLRHCEGYVDYWVVNGTTGESVTLSPAERAAVLAFVRRHNSRQLPIVYGLGGIDTRLLVQELQNSDLSGIDAILSVSPYYYKPSQEGIYQHYTALANASPLPVLLYNVPGRTGANLSAATTLRLAQHPNIAGIKESSGDLVQCMKIAKHKPADFLLISGDDILTAPLIGLGAQGVISVLANAFPRAFAQMVRHALKDEGHLAGKASLPFVEINDLMYAEGNPVGIKAALAQLGIAEAHVRPPHAPASEALRQRIAEAMSQMQQA